MDGMVGRPARSLVSAALVALLLTGALLTGVPVATAAPALPALPAVPALPTAVTLPAGFVLRDAPSGQAAYDLTNFEYLPDGSVISTGKGGKVAVVSPTGAVTTIATIPVTTEQDLGLTGLALAPDFATSRTVYLSYAVGSGAGRVTRLSAWRAAGTDAPTGLTGERVILSLPQDSNVHAGTHVVAASDGTLWWSVGDGADFTRVDPLALRAQEPNDGHGKLLHLTPGGAGVPSNPGYQPGNPTSWPSRTYASGFRSPFRFSLDPSTGQPVLGEVGWNTWEEVNLVRPGANYGWPCFEGDGPTPGYTDLAGCAGRTNTAPLWTYNHASGGTSVTGGLVYTGTSYPEAYRGAFFFGDYTKNSLQTLRYDGSGQRVGTPALGNLGSGIGGPVAFRAGPGGDVVFADILTGKLRRLVYTPGNRAPTASFTATVDPVSRTATVDAGATYDLDGDALTYAWDFGDGARATGVTATHTYAPTVTAPQTITLTVTDTAGKVGTDTTTVTPGNASPRLALTTPRAGTQYAVGDRVSLSAVGEDAEDGTLAVTWRSELIHCGSATTCHVHPQDTTTAPTFSTTFSDHGEDTSLRIVATVTDSARTTTERVFTAEPRQHTLTLAPSTPATMTVGAAATTSARITAGASLTVAAAATASDGASTFTRWSDGGARQHTVTMPDADLTLTATYTFASAIDARYSSDAAMRAAIGAPNGAEVGDTTLRWRDYANGRAYWTPAGGVHWVAGAIKAAFLAQGAHPRLGVPTTDEVAGPGGGASTTFAGTAATGGVASIHWTGRTGAHLVYGEIRRAYVAAGAERGTLGYPTTDEFGTPDGRGRLNRFDGGAVYWTPQTGPQPVLGAIWARYQAIGYETGPLGYPRSGEMVTPDGGGRYQFYERGSMYWSPRSGAWEVYGAILTRWGQLGYERSYLGYPTSGEFAVPGGRRTNFQNGYIQYTFAGARLTDRRY